MLHRLLYIFLIFRAICEYHASGNLSLLLPNIHRAIFSHLRANKALLSKCLTHRCKQVVIGKSQVWWVSRTGLNFPAKCFRRVANQFCHIWWRIFMKKTDFLLPLSIFGPFSYSYTWYMLYLVSTVLYQLDFIEKFRLWPQFLTFRQLRAHVENSAPSCTFPEKFPDQLTLRIWKTRRGLRGEFAQVAGVFRRVLESE